MQLWWAKEASLFDLTSNIWSVVYITSYVFPVCFIIVFLFKCWIPIVTTYPVSCVTTCPALCKTLTVCSLKCLTSQTDSILYCTVNRQSFFIRFSVDLCLVTNTGCSQAGYCLIVKQIEMLCMNILCLYLAEVNMCPRLEVQPAQRDAENGQIWKVNTNVILLFRISK